MLQHVFILFHTYTLPPRGKRAMEHWHANTLLPDNAGCEFMMGDHKAVSAAPVFWPGIPCGQRVSGTSCCKRCDTWASGSEYLLQLTGTDTLYLIRFNTLIGIYMYSKETRHSHYPISVVPATPLGAFLSPG